MIILKLKPEIRLKSETWMDRQEWDENFRDNLPALIELLDEDFLAVLEEANGRSDCAATLAGLVVGAEWVDADSAEKEAERG